MRVRVRLRPARSTIPWRYFRRWRPAGKHLQIDGDDFLENRQRHGNAADAQALQESWGDAGGPEAALHLAGIGHTDALEGEDLLQIHLLILHPQYFTDGEDFTGSVLQAGNLHDELDGAGQLLEDDAGGNFEIGHHHHGFQAREGVAGCIGVHRAHGPLDAGVHGLEHVQGFGAAALANDDAVGAHAEGGAQQNALVDAAFLIEVGRAGFELDHVALLELQFRRVFDGDDALFLRDEARQRVEHGGLAGAGSAGDQHGNLALHARRKEAQDAGSERLERHHFVLRDDVAAEPADAEAGAVERQRRNYGVDARTVLQARIDNRLGFIDAPAHLGHDLLDDVQQVGIVLEADGGFGELAVALDEYLVIAVDQDVAEAGLFEQRFQGAETEDFVEHFLDDLGLLGGRHGHALFVEQAFHDAADLGADAVLGDGRGALQVEHADELAVDLRFEFEVAVGAAGGDGQSAATRRQGSIGSHLFSLEVAPGAVQSIPIISRTPLSENTHTDDKHYGAKPQKSWHHDDQQKYAHVQS